VESYTDLTSNKTRSGHTLRVSNSLPLTLATSNPINVTKTGETSTTLLAPALSPVSCHSVNPLVLDNSDYPEGLGFKEPSRRV
jgi:hypothetical protein